MRLEIILYIKLIKCSRYIIYMSIYNINIMLLPFLAVQYGLMDPTILFTVADGPVTLRNKYHIIN